MLLILTEQYRRTKKTAKKRLSNKRLYIEQKQKRCEGKKTQRNERGEKKTINQKKMNTPMPNHDTEHNTTMKETEEEILKRREQHDIIYNRSGVITCLATKRYNVIAVVLGIAC